jgi:GT2 family glycosyltransferase
MTTVAAVIVRWRGGDEIDRCLRSITTYGGPNVSRIVLVDSGSDDGGAERLTASFPEIDVVALERNLSFAHAANVGVRACSEEYVFLLNPDTELSSDSVDILVSELDSRPQAAGVTPLLVSPDGSQQHRWQLRQLPTPFRLAIGRPGAPVFSSTPAATTPVQQPAAAAWLVRRSVWTALDGLDPLYAPAWWEDVDFCVRLAKGCQDPSFPVEEGFSVVPQAQVVHARGSSVGELADAAFLLAYYQNSIRFAGRHHPGEVESIKRILRLSLSLRALFRPARRRAYIKASKSLVPEVES